jgi:hypothetical protein
MSKTVEITLQKRVHVLASNRASSSSAAISNHSGLPPGAKIGPPKKGTPRMGLPAGGKGKAALKDVKRHPSPIILLSDDENDNRAQLPYQNTQDNQNTLDVVMLTAVCVFRAQFDYVVIYLYL